ncbi:MAG: DUF572 domain-containing protein [Akkermansiaceae bacterium]|nr:DUF572 domain-containing protein [Akkermansiaceae bacterium]
MNLRCGTCHKFVSKGTETVCCRQEVPSGESAGPSIMRHIIKCHGCVASIEFTTSGGRRFHLRNGARKVKSRGHGTHGRDDQCAARAPESHAQDGAADAVAGGNSQQQAGYPRHSRGHRSAEQSATSKPGVACSDQQGDTVHRLVHPAPVKTPPEAPVHAQLPTEPLNFTGAWACAHAQAHRVHAGLHKHRFKDAEITVLSAPAQPAAVLGPAGPAGRGKTPSAHRRNRAEADRPRSRAVPARQRHGNSPPERPRPHE